jgi:hypothetical protein
MWRMRQRVARLAGVVFLCALLLPSLALRAHRHADHPSAAPCALCVVANHAPLVTAPAFGAVAPIFHGIALPLRAHALAGRHHAPTATGRAPPSAGFARVA